MILEYRDNSDMTQCVRQAKKILEK